MEVMGKEKSVTGKGSQMSYRGEKECRSEGEKGSKRSNVQRGQGWQWEAMREKGCNKCKGDKKEVYGVHGG